MRSCLVVSAELAEPNHAYTVVVCSTAIESQSGLRRQLVGVAADQCCRKREHVHDWSRPVSANADGQRGQWHDNVRR